MTIAPKQKVVQTVAAPAVKRVLTSAYMDAKIREARQLRAEKFAEVIRAAIAGIRNVFTRLLTGKKGPTLMAHR